MKNNKLTINDIFRSTVNACIGEIYPSIRQICFKTGLNNKYYCLRLYLDRSPTDHDFEAARMISGYVFGDYWSFFEEVTEECIYSEEHRSKLDPLDAIVYSRREYDLDEVS